MSQKHFFFTFTFLFFCLSFGQIFAQSFFSNDTLFVNVPTFSSNNSDSIGYEVTKPNIKYFFKKKSGDKPDYAGINYDDTNWEIDSTELISNEEANDILWYRFKMQIDSNHIGRTLMMIIDAEGILEFYLDGKPHTNIGYFTYDKSEKTENLYINAHPIQLTFTEAKTYQIAIRFKSNIDKRDGTLTWMHIRLEDVMYYQYQAKYGGIFSGIVFLGTGTLFLTLFLVHMMFFLFYRKGKDNLIFAIFALSIAILMLGVYAYFNAESMRWDSMYLFSFNYVPLISCFSLCAFISYVFAKNNKLLLIIAGLCILSLLLAILDAYAIFKLSFVFIWILLAVSLLFTIIMIIKAIIKKIPGSLILGSGVLYFLLFFIGLIIISTINGEVHFNTGLSYLTVSAFFGIPFSISAYLAWRFATTSKNLQYQINTVETLFEEKQQMLASQNEKLEFQVAERTQELLIEKQKSDDLLLNILPHEVAEELKEKGSSKATYYDEVSVIFTDFVNFTATSEKIGAEAMLQELNECFTAFDLIMESRGLEKIKTIGDAYLAVSGLPIQNAQHATNAIRAAIDIIEFIDNRRKERPNTLDIRIGIHSGSLIAGIVGVKKFAYDIWGDTVNTAARMEQTSKPGKINISADTYRLTKDTFTFESRGDIQVKGKGTMEMYFVNTPQTY